MEMISPKPTADKILENIFAPDTSKDLMNEEELMMVMDDAQSNSTLITEKVDPITGNEEPLITEKVDPIITGKEEPLSIKKVDPIITGKEEPLITEKVLVNS